MEIKNTGEIKVKLNKKIDNGRFYLNGKLVNATLSNALGEENTYIISSSQTSGKFMTNEDENVLRVTDIKGTFDETYNFVRRTIYAPSSAAIIKTSTNEKNSVNATNVNNSTLEVTFGTTNAVAVDLEITITDSSAEKKVVTLSKKAIEAYKGYVTIENVDLSTLADGQLKVTATAKDDQGNITTTSSTIGTINKYADVPVLKYTSVSRSSATVTIDLLKTNKSNNIYALVKEAGEPAPSVADIVKTTKITHDITTDETPQITVNIPNNDDTKAYVVYLVEQTTAGTNSEVLPVNIAINTATQLTEVSNLKNKTGSKTTFVWEDTINKTSAGLVGYKAILVNSDSSNVVAEKTLEPDVKEVDFNSEMKKAGAGNYKIKIIALADNVEHKDSTETELSNAIEIKEVATSITVDFGSGTSANDPKTLVKWTLDGGADDTNISDYTVEIAKYNKKTNKYESIKTINTSKTSCNIVDEVSELGAYAVRVIANAKSDILMVNKYSEEDDNFTSAPTEKYIKADSMKDLSLDDVKETEVTLLGSKLPDVYPLDTSITYKIYWKVAGGTYIESSSYYKDITSLETPYKITGLTNGTQYYFKVKTIVNGVEYVNDEDYDLTVTTKKSPVSLNTSNTLTYTKYVAQSTLENTANLSNNQITYHNNTLYIKDGTSSVKTYTPEDTTVVSDIIAVLSQFDLENSESLTIKFTNNAISELTITAPTTAKIYNLEKVPEVAKVTITGNTAKTTVTGKLNNIILDGTTPKFDLSGLTATNVTVDATDSELAVANNTGLTFDTSAKKAKVNDVSFTTNSSSIGLEHITVEANDYKVTGDPSNTLTVETSKAVNLTFVGKHQKELDIVGNIDNLVKVSTGEIIIEDIKIKNGKVDLIESQFNQVTAGNTSAPEIKIILSETAVGATNNSVDITKNTVSIDEQTTLSGYKFTTTSSSNAKYSTKTNSNEITLELGASVNVIIKK